MRGTGGSSAWAVATHLRAELVIEALNMAIWQRRPNGGIHHSDQGTLGRSPAASAAELLDRQRFRTQSEARMAVFDFIEGFYNPWRRHSALGYLSPIGFER